MMMMTSACTQLHPHSRPYVPYSAHADQYLTPPYFYSRPTECTFPSPHTYVFNAPPPRTSLFSNFSCPSCRFHTSSFSEFLSQLIDHNMMQKSTLIVSMHYLKQILALQPFLLSTMPCSLCLFATCAVLASKYLIDECSQVNLTWANVLGIPVAQMNKYERELLSAFDYNINVSAPAYASIHDTVVSDLCTLLVRPRPSPPRLTCAVDPAIFRTREFQCILKELYAMT